MKRSTSATCRRLWALAFVLGLGTFATLQAQAQTFNVLYSFKGVGDGGNPLAGLAMDATGDLYGTASAGGSSGAGVVFLSLIHI